MSAALSPLHTLSATEKRLALALDTLADKRDEIEQLQTRIARRDKKILALLKKYDNMFLQDNFMSVRVAVIRAELAALAQAADTEAK